RGFRQNELGPVAYVMANDPVALPLAGGGDSLFTLQVRPGDQPLRIVPVGGNTVAVGNAELRVRSPFLPTVLQYTLFADVGQVWSRGAPDASLRDNTLRVTPGLGVRFFSPIGVIRLDFGYNDFAPRAGAAYFNAPIRADGTAPLQCVSPGNTIVARRVNGVFEQEPYQSCTGSYQPRPQRGFLGPVTFFFAIGQAF
nr:BamA/TamA family outer membrane protein [Gemmatimonadaceae bacterium]